MTALPPMTEETGRPPDAPLDITKFAFDRAADGILVLDGGRVIAANEAACHMLGYDRDELIGCPLDALSADDPIYTQQRAAEWLAHSGPATSRVFEWHYKGKNGRLYWVELSLCQAPLRGHDASIVRGGGIVGHGAAASGRCVAA